MDSASVECVAIYALIDPRNNEIRYVGWTSKPLNLRLKQHLRSTLLTHKRAAWVAKLKRLGYLPRIELIQMVPSQVWQEAERYWISFYRALGCPLVNGTDGGEGTPGQKHTEETRKKMSLVWEARKEQGFISPQKGRKFSEERRAQMSEATRRQMADPEQRAAVSRVHKGKKISDAQKAANSVRSKQMWADWRANGSYTSPETRAKISAAKKGRVRGPHSPESKAKMSAAKMGHEVTPETLSKMLATRRANALAKESIQMDTLF